MIAPYRGSRIGVFLACDFSVIKTLVLQHLLCVRDGLVSMNRRCPSNQNQNGDFSSHVDVGGLTLAFGRLFASSRRADSKRWLKPLYEIAVTNDAFADGRSNLLTIISAGEFRDVLFVCEKSSFH